MKFVSTVKLPEKPKAEDLVYVPELSDCVFKDKEKGLKYDRELKAAHEAYLKEKAQWEKDNPEEAEQQRLEKEKNNEAFRKELQSLFGLDDINISEMI